MSDTLPEWVVNVLGVLLVAFACALIGFGWWAHACVEGPVPADPDRAQLAAQVETERARTAYWKAQAAAWATFAESGTSDEFFERAVEQDEARRVLEVMGVEP